MGVGFALAVILGLLFAQWSGLPVLTYQLAQLLRLALEQVWPALPAAETIAQVACAFCLCGFACVCLLPGLRERLWAMLFVLTAVLAGGLLGAVVLSRNPSMQHAAEAYSLGNALPYALAGIPLAMPTFLVRPWLLGDWRRDAIAQSRDAAFGAGVLVACCLLAWSVCLGLCSSGGSAGAIARQLFVAEFGLGGWFFLVAALAAGLTSVLPMAIAVPVMLADCRRSDIELRSATSIALIFAAITLALGGLAIGDKVAAWHRLAGQVAQVLIPPCVIGGLIYELNFGRNQCVGVSRWLNAGLAMALALAMVAAVLAAKNVFTLL